MALSLNRKEAVEHVADVFEATALGAPFKVLLHKSVTVSFDPISNEVVSYKIPDIPQLLGTVLLTRLLHSRKLSGPEVKFARKVIGLKQSELARKTEVSPEHLSRCENGATPLSPQGEKLLRVFALKEVLKLPDMPKSDDKAKLEDALDSIFDDMSISSAHAAGDEIELHFTCEKSEMGKDEKPQNCHINWQENDEKKVA
ncbi:DNA-binding transcriptional regulator [Pelagibius sp. Alg239-R121]|uniref:helix-turn-helix domain-containing protein n=1 Tax=Pelagibius sp. Alg239-R121 TaxID=2993448 RepID=UPI0024A6B7E8|nr:hypothetical protein [Pelagibius sp. Alg239-R121]